MNAPAKAVTIIYQASKTDLKQLKYPERLTNYIQIRLSEKYPLNLMWVEHVYNFKLVIAVVVPSPEAVAVVVVVVVIVVSLWCHFWR